VNINSGYIWNYGEMIVGSDFRIQAKDNNNNFVETTGYFWVGNGGTLTAYGDFYTQTTNNTYGFSSSSSVQSEMVLYGSLYQIGASTFFRHVNENNFKIVFAGAGEQRISFDRHDSSASLGRIEVVNTSQTIYLDTPTHKLHPLNDFTIVGDTSIQVLGGSGNNISIIGSFVITANANQTVNSYHKIAVTENFNLRSGRFHIWDDLSVGGDFRIQGVDSNGNFIATNADVQLVNAAKLTVYGDFYTQSTFQGAFSWGNWNTTTPTTCILELHGDFNQIGTNTFFFHSKEEYFKIVFAGDGEQRISFDRYNSSASLGRIEVVNTSQMIYLDTPTYKLHPLNDFTIAGDVNIQVLAGSNRTINIEGSLDVRHGLKNRHKITVSENVYIQSGHLWVYNNIVVHGDFRIQARDNNGDFGVTSARVWIESDIRLTVCGDFYTQTTNSGTFGGGSSAKPSIFELHGDFYQIGTNTFFRHTNNGHITVFAGGGGQHVSFDKKDSAVSLGTVRVDSSSRSQSQGGRSSVADIIFEDYLPSMSIGSNMVIAKSVNNTAETLYLNGYTVTFKSTANLGNVILGGGKLICERQLILNGTLNLGGGLLSVTEDVILNGNGTLGMANVSDVVYIGGNLLINRASNITTLGRGLIDIKGDIRIAASNFNLSTGTLHYFRFSGTAPQKIVYYTNASVYLWNLDAPNPQHVIVTRGNISRYLDGTYVSGTCSNTNCTTTATCNNCKHIEIYKHPFDYNLELAGIPPNNRIVLGETWDELDLLSKPYNASYPGVVWRTDSAYVADIDPKTGKITANNVGGTAIHARSVVDDSLIAWFFVSVVKPQYNLTVYHHYDEGYAVRFPNAVSNINSYQDVVSAILLDVFDLEVTSYVNATSYRSVADDCKIIVTPLNILNFCTHVHTLNPCNLSLNSMRDNFVGQHNNGDDTISLFAWTGHVITDNDGNINAGSPSYAPHHGFPGFHIVVMSIKYVTNSSYVTLGDILVQREYIYTLLHETSHQIGANDHYCRNNGSPCSNSHCFPCKGLERPVCIMSRRFMNIEAEVEAGNTLFCTVCAGNGGTITTHLASHH